MTWKIYGVSLANAAISGLASGLLSVGVGLGARKALVVALGAGIVSLAKWISQHRLPGAVD